MELWHLTNLVTDEGVGERSDVVPRDTDAKIETVVTRELKQVEKRRSSILLGVELQVELVDEDEAVGHDGTLLSRQLGVLGVKRGNWQGLDEGGDLLIDSCHGREVFFLVQLLQNVRLGQGEEKQLADGRVRFEEASEVEIEDVGESIECAIESEDFLLWAISTDILAINFLNARFSIENKSNVVEGILFGFLKIIHLFISAQENAHFEGEVDSAISNLITAVEEGCEGTRVSGVSCQES